MAIPHSYFDPNLYINKDRFNFVVQKREKHLVRIRVINGIRVCLLRIRVHRESFMLGPDMYEVQVFQYGEDYHISGGSLKSGHRVFKDTVKLVRKTYRIPFRELPLHINVGTFEKALILKRLLHGDPVKKFWGKFFGWVLG